MQNLHTLGYSHIINLDIVSKNIQNIISVHPSLRSTHTFPQMLIKKYLIKHYPNFSTAYNLNKDYYKILGLKNTASNAEIKNAYYTLAKKYHPDLTGDSSKENQNKFKEINQAYSVLSDPNTKSQYESNRKEYNMDVNTTNQYYKPTSSQNQYDHQYQPYQNFGRNNSRNYYYYYYYEPRQNRNKNYQWQTHTSRKYPHENPFQFFERFRQQYEHQMNRERERMRQQQYWSENNQNRNNQDEQTQQFFLKMQKLVRLFIIGGLFSIGFFLIELMRQKNNIFDSKQTPNNQTFYQRNNNNSKGYLEKEKL